VYQRRGFDFVVVWFALALLELAVLRGLGEQVPAGVSVKGDWGGRMPSLLFGGRFVIGPILRLFSLREGGVYLHGFGDPWGERRQRE